MNQVEASFLLDFMLFLCYNKIDLTIERNSDL